MICEKCNKEFFKDWRKDEGAKKKTCRFCSIECANSRNHSKKTKEKTSASLHKYFETEPKLCNKCGRKLNFSNKSGFCKNCKSPAKSKGENQKASRKRRREYLIKYKGGKCEICGYNKCIGALDFHHLDPSNKSFSIASTGRRNIERNMEIDIKEVDKCILLCSNCHRELHYELNNKPNLL